MAEAALGPEAGPNLVHTLFHRSEGLPLIAEEDLITLSERVRQGDRTNTEAFAVDPEQAAVPTGLREAVSERVANLSASGVAVTEAAAVLALPSTEQMLTAVTGLPSDRGSQGLTEALRAFTLDESQPAHYAFRRVLAQQAVYERIPGPERQRLHRRAADALRVQTPQPLMQIAHHTLALGDREGWLDYAEAAVDQATEVGDAGTATRVLRDILAQTHLSGDLRSRAALALARIAVQGVDAVNSQSVLWQILADPQLPTADAARSAWRSACSWSDRPATRRDSRRLSRPPGNSPTAQAAPCGRWRPSPSTNATELGSSRQSGSTAPTMSCGSMTTRPDCGPSGPVGSGSQACRTRISAPLPSACAPPHTCGVTRTTHGREVHTIGA